MVSSIRLKEIEQLKSQKKIDRAKEAEEFAQAEAERIAEKEASDKRIAKKMAIIASGGVVPNPKPVVIKKEPVAVEEPKKKVTKKKVTKKKVTKKKVAKKK